MKAIAYAHEPDGSHPAQALALGDRIATLRLLLDGGMIGDDDPLVMHGLSGAVWASCRSCQNKPRRAAGGRCVRVEFLVRPLEIHEIFW